MKKVILSITAVVVVVVLLAFQPVQSLAVSMLSIFRVGDTKTIQITMADIEEMYKYAQANHDRQDTTALKEWKEGIALTSKSKFEIKPLQSVDEFSGFPISLPEALAEEKPQLSMIESQEVSAVLNTEVINEYLRAMGSQETFNEKFNGEKVSVTTPPVLHAKYEKVELIATQGPYLNSGKELNQAAWDIMISMPGIPENIRTQLAEIDIDKRDIYLPVITGVGREVAVGNTSGYLYAAADVKSLAQSMQTQLNLGDAPIAAETSENSQEDAKVLIFTKNNTLFILEGSVSENELIEIGRSIRL